MMEDFRWIEGGVVSASFSRRLGTDKTRVLWFLAYCCWFVPGDESICISVRIFISGLLRLFLHHSELRSLNRTILVYLWFCLVLSNYLFSILIYLIVNIFTVNSVFHDFVFKER